MQQFAGRINVSNESGTVYEVYVYFDEETGTPEHVVVVHGRRQICDFPYGQPNKDDSLSHAAQYLVESKKSEVEFCWPGDSLIDWEDTLRIWKEAQDANDPERDR